MLLWELIPKVEGKGQEDKVYLKRLWTYLDENGDVKKLRNKTGKYFLRLDIEYNISFKGLLTESYDDLEDPMPDTLVDHLKDIMKELFEETHGKKETRFNYGKALGETIDGAIVPPTEKGGDEEDGERFQRKILPFDALNLASGLEESKKGANAAGSQKQDLILCCALIDKPPNLGGKKRDRGSSEATENPNVILQFS